MRFLLALLLTFLGVIQFSLAQTKNPYVAAFDIADSAKSNNWGNGYSYYINASMNPKGGTVALDGEADLMHAYITMFRATHDTKYLNKFIIHSKRVQERRDDNVNKLNPRLIANRTLSKKLNPSLPDAYAGYGERFLSYGWSYDIDINPNSGEAEFFYGWAPTPLYAGKIIFPMVEFIYLLDNEFPEIQQEVLPFEALGIEKYQVQDTFSYDISDSLTQFNTYLDYRNWLYKRVLQSYVFLNNNYWNDKPGVYNCSDKNDVGYFCQLRTHCLGGPGTDINQQCAIGKSLIYLSKIVPDSSRWKAGLDKQVKDIAYSLRCILETNPRNKYAYTWPEAFKNHTGHKETVGHGIEDAQFMELAYQLRVEEFPNKLFFNIEDVKKMARTISLVVYRKPYDFASIIDGSGQKDNWTALYYGFLIPYEEDLFQVFSHIANESVCKAPKAACQVSYLAHASSEYFTPQTPVFIEHALWPKMVLDGKVFTLNKRSFRVDSTQLSIDTETPAESIFITIDSSILNIKQYKIIGVSFAYDAKKNYNLVYLLTDNAQVLILRQINNDWQLITREKFSLKYRPTEIDSYPSENKEDADNLVLRFAFDKRIIHYYPNLSTNFPQKDSFLLKDIFERTKNLFNVDK